MIIPPPEIEEYGSYYDGFVEIVRSGNVLEILADQQHTVLTVMEAISETKAAHRYAEGKWSIKELTGHLIDTERVYVYRAFRFSRNDRTPLPGYDQDAYVQASNYSTRTYKSIMDELSVVREATLSFFNGINEEMLGLRGFANDLEFTVRAMPWIIAGHMQHHFDVLQSKYL